MSDKILFAYSCDEKLANAIIVGLNKEGANITGGVIKYMKESAIAELTKPGFDCTVLLMQYSLEIKSPLTVKDCDRIMTLNDSINFIPIIPKSFKGTEFVQGLLEAGVNNALFDNEATMPNIATLIKKRGRTRKEAKQYYGVVSASGVGEVSNERVVDPAAYIKYIALDNPDEDLKTRIEHVKANVSSEQFAAIMHDLPFQIKDRLIADGVYTVYFAKEAAAKESESSSQRVVRSVDSKIIGVVSLSDGAGATMVALNVISKMIQNSFTGTGTFVQLPSVHSKLYDEYGFADIFGTGYISFVSEIMHFGNASRVKNIYKGINFCVVNPHTDASLIPDWTPEMNYKLLLSLQGNVVLDLGTFPNELCQQLAPSLTHLIIVVDMEENAMKNRVIREKIDELKRIQNVEIAFVANKCVDGVDEQLGRIVGPDNVIALPNIKPDVFKRAGDEIVCSEYDTEFSAILDKIGIDRTVRPVSVEHSEKKKWFKQKQTEKADIVVRNSNCLANISTGGMTVEIGVGGVCRGVGTTHTAFMIANILSEHFSVAVVEQNQSRVFANFYMRNNPKDSTRRDRAPRFTYHEIDFYPYCKYAQFNEKYKSRYDFVVVDFGSEWNCSDYKAMPRRIMVASASDWKEMELYNHTKDIRKNHSISGPLMYMIPFAEPERIAEIKKKCEKLDMGDKFYSVPFCPDWESTSNEIAIVVTDILSEPIGKRKKHRFFGK